MPNASHGRAESFRDLRAFGLSSYRDGDAHVIALAGELDRWTIAGLERELERVERTDARFIVLDLRELAFIACSGLQVIVMAHRRQAGRLIVLKGPQHVHRVFEICYLAGCCSPSRSAQDGPDATCGVEGRRSGGGGCGRVAIRERDAGEHHDRATEEAPSDWLDKDDCAEDDGDDG